MSSKDVMSSATGRRIRAWATAAVIVLFASGILWFIKIPPGNKAHPQVWYALTASAQSLAAVLGLVLATATFVAQLRGLFSKRTLGNRDARDVFGRETVAMIGLYAFVIWAQLAAVSARSTSALETRGLLLGTAVCLAGLAPFLTQLRSRLAPNTALQDARKRLSREGDGATQAIADVQDFALTAVEQHDYATLRESVGVLCKRLEDPYTSGASVLEGVAESLSTIAVVGERDPVTIPFILAKLGEVVGNVRPGEQDGRLSMQQARVLGLVAQVAGTVAERAVQRPDQRQAATCAQVLGTIAERLTITGHRDALGTPVRALVNLLNESGTERLLNVSGHAAHHLGRVRPGATAERVWPDRSASPDPTNLLLNGSFEFGHDFGLGREPAWHPGPFAQTMGRKAQAFDGPPRVGQCFLSMNADAKNQSIAQDVPCSPSIGDSYVAACRIAPGGGATVEGRIALWGLGRTDERGETRFDARGWESPHLSAWREMRVPLDVSQHGVEALRVEVYIDRTAPEPFRREQEGGELCLDDVALVHVALKNASFEMQDDEWWRVEGPGTAKYVRHPHPPRAYPSHLGGDWFRRLEPTEAPLAVRQTVDLPGAEGESYELMAAIRSDAGARVSLDVRAAGETQAREFVATSEWRVVVLPFVAGQSTNTVSCDVGLTVQGGPAELDAVAIVPTYLRSTDFQTLSSWTASPPSAVELVSADLDDFGAVHVARLRGHRSRATLRQDVDAQPRVGASFKYSVRIRAVQAGSVNVDVRLEVYGANDVRLGEVVTTASVTEVWEVVSVPYDCNRGDVYGLRACVDVPAGATVDLAGPTFNPLVL